MPAQHASAGRRVGTPQLQGLPLPGAMTSQVIGRPRPAGPEDSLTAVERTRSMQIGPAPPHCVRNCTPVRVNRPVPTPDSLGISNCTSGP
jgi:hypothetical protein